MIDTQPLIDACWHWEEVKERCQREINEGKAEVEKCKKTIEKANVAIFNLKKSLEEEGYGK